MAQFFYKAKKGPGDILEDVIEAESRSQALSKIESLGYFLIELKEQSQAESGKNPFAQLSQKVALKDLAIFTRQLSDLLGAGLTILNALEVLSQQAENKRLKVVCRDMVHFIKDGGTFSDALNQYPKIFSSLYVAMAQAGEVGGMLEPVLNRLADFSEAEEDLKTKVRSALAYPLLMGFVGAGTIIVLLTFVIPKLVGMFEDMGQALPLPTQLLVNISGFLTDFWWLIAGIVAGLIFTIKRRVSTPEGKLVFDKIKISLFLIGPLVKKVEIARLVRTLSALLSNGVPMLQALQVSGKIIENEVLKQDIGRIAKEVSDGADFSAALKSNPIFPVFVSNMITVGEKGGQIEKALVKVAEAYEREIDRATGTLTSLLEPIMILVMGSIVGFIVVSMLLPIFQINLMAR